MKVCLISVLCIIKVVRCVAVHCTTCWRSIQHHTKWAVSHYVNCVTSQAQRPAVTACPDHFSIPSLEYRYHRPLEQFAQIDLTLFSCSDHFPNALCLLQVQGRRSRGTERQCCPSLGGRRAACFCSRREPYHQWSRTRICICGARRKEIPDPAQQDRPQLFEIGGWWHLREARAGPRQCWQFMMTMTWALSIEWLLFDFLGLSFNAIDGKIKKTCTAN